MQRIRERGHRLPLFDYVKFQSIPRFHYLPLHKKVEMFDKSALTAYLTDLLATDVRLGGLFVVSVDLLSGGVIDISVDSDSDISVDQCAAINSALRAHFGEQLDDYELTVGSYGLTAPLLLPRQYVKNIGTAVEVLTTDGRKLHGTLRHADGQAFTLDVPRKVRPEGKKRPETVVEALRLEYAQVKRAVCDIQL